MNLNYLIFLFMYIILTFFFFLATTLYSLLFNEKFCIFVERQTPIFADFLNVAIKSNVRESKYDNSFNAETCIMFS